MKNKKGFTLLEILLVIGIIAALAVVVIVALDPAKRFRDARDARRTSDIESISSAISQYIVDNKGAIPPGITTEEFMIGTSSSGCSNNYTGGCNANNNSCVDLSASLAKYLKTIPYDPQTGSEGTTQYTVVRDDNGIVTVRACGAEGGEIYISR